MDKNSQANPSPQNGAKPKAAPRSAGLFRPELGGDLPCGVAGKVVGSMVDAALRSHDEYRMELHRLGRVLPDRQARARSGAIAVRSVLLDIAQRSDEYAPLVMTLGKHGTNDVTTRAVEGFNLLLRHHGAYPDGQRSDLTVKLEPWSAPDGRADAGKYVLIAVSREPLSAHEMAAPSHVEVKLQVDHPDPPAPRDLITPETESRARKLSLSLAEYCRHVRYQFDGQWDDQSEWPDKYIHSAVRTDMVTLDAATPQRKDYLLHGRRPTQAEYLQHIRGALIALTKRMDMWPECSRFIVDGSNIVGYVSCWPVADERVLLGDAFMQADRAPASGTSVPPLDSRPKVLYVSSVRLLDSARKDRTLRAALTLALVQVLEALARPVVGGDRPRPSVLFDRIYVCSHHDHEDKSLVQLQDCDEHRAREQTPPTEYRNCNPPIYRLHLRPWSINEQGSWWKPLRSLYEAAEDYATS